jgi:hypothetical protein
VLGGAASTVELPKILLREVHCCKNQRIRNGQGNRVVGTASEQLVRCGCASESTKLAIPETSTPLLMRASVMLKSGDSISSSAITPMNTTSAPSSNEIGGPIPDDVERPSVAYLSLIEASIAKKYTVLKFRGCRHSQKGSSLTAYILHNVHCIFA